MDDVYAELYQLKKSKNMSFSEILRYLLKERRDESRSIMNLAGSIDSMDLDRKGMDKIKKTFSAIK